MALPWVRLDTALPDNPKVLALVDGHRDGRASAFVYICGLTYSGKHGLDGFLPRECLSRSLHGRPEDARRLVAAGLWKESPAGWEINGWMEFQASSQENRDRSSKARAAAELRWAKERERKAGGE